MTKDQFKLFCLNEFQISRYSKAEYFEPMVDIFGIKGRTFVDWCQKGRVQPYFIASSKLYLENKKISGELRLIYKKLTSS